MRDLVTVCLLLAMNGAHGAHGDTRLHFAHGGVADFRGKPHTWYNVLSHRNISVNALFAYCEIPWEKLNMKRIIYGTYLSHVFITLRTKSGKFINVEYNTSRMSERRGGIPHGAFIWERGDDRLNDPQLGRRLEQHGKGQGHHGHGSHAGESLASSPGPPIAQQPMLTKDAASVASPRPASSPYSERSSSSLPMAKVQQPTASTAEVVGSPVIASVSSSETADGPVSPTYSEQSSSPFPTAHIPMPAAQASTQAEAVAVLDTALTANGGHSLGLVHHRSGPGPLSDGSIVTEAPVSARYSERSSNILPAHTIQQSTPSIEAVAASVTTSVASPKLVSPAYSELNTPLALPTGQTPALEAIVSTQVSPVPTTGATTSSQRPTDSIASKPPPVAKQSPKLLAKLPKSSHTSQVSGAKEKTWYKVGDRFKLENVNVRVEQGTGGPELHVIFQLGGGHTWWVQATSTRTESGTTGPNNQPLESILDLKVSAPF